MNIGIITRLEVKEVGADEFTEVSFTGFSASFQAEAVKSNAGFSYKVAIKLKIKEMSEATTSFLHNLLGRALTIKFIDGNDRVHTIGDSTYPARLAYNSGIGGSPGDWNGYEVYINHESPDPHTIG